MVKDQDLNRLVDAVQVVGLRVETAQNELTADRKEREQERQRADRERRRSRQIIAVLVAVVLFSTYQTISNRHAANSARLAAESSAKTSRQLEDCVSPPPAGYQGKPTCFQRAQAQTSAAIVQLLTGFDAELQQRLQEALNAALGRSVVIPHSPSVVTGRPSGSAGPSRPSGGTTTSTSSPPRSSPTTSTTQPCRDPVTVPGQCVIR